MWPAYAVDGKGHHGGDGKYIAQVPVADFGVHLYLGGEARFVRPPFGGDPKDVYRLPMAPPTTTVVVTFNIQVNPLASLGRLTMISAPRGAPQKGNAFRDTFRFSHTPTPYLHE